MSEDRLDQIESALAETRNIVESNAKAIEAWANEAIQYRRESEERDQVLESRIERLANSLERLIDITNVIATRYEDHEDRINRLERQSKPMEIFKAFSHRSFRTLFRNTHNQ
jgi:predicted patatin/cPLA2 family phospholipase